MKKVFFGLLLLINVETLAANQGSDFIAIRQAFQSGDAVRLANYAKRLQGNVLEPYAAYYQLRLQLGNPDTDISRIKGFLSYYKDSLLSDTMRGQWLKTLGKKQEWELFAAEYSALVNKDDELTCYSLQQRLSVNDDDALKEARLLWFNGKTLPKNCTSLFNELVTAKLLSTDDVWLRLRLAFEAGEIETVKRINRYLPNYQALNEKALNAVSNSPLSYLNRYRDKIETRADREIILFAMLQLLHNNLDQAYAYWLEIHEQFSQADRSYFMGQLASKAAKKLDPRALDWFIEAANIDKLSPLSDTQLSWKTRAALRAGDWTTVLESIEAMSVPEQKVAAWLYWKARALKVQGNIIESDAILRSLSTEHHFYGLLAGEDLDILANEPINSYKVEAEQVSLVQQMPGIQRALALYKLNLRIEAIREWTWAIREFNDKQLLAAAEIARLNGIYDRAINIADKTLKEHDFNLRYPAPHRESLGKILKKRELDEALVYGLIRQESRFIDNAKSTAGAMGLMQLMPTTAKWVAKKLGMSNYRQATATEVDINLILGTYYLKHVLTLLDNQPLLASAAYNAGPRRAQQWRDLKPLEGAVYAETIPFSETRDYVKKVMSNSVYYARTLGHQTKTLKERLGIISPKIR